ncbi:MAG: DUF1800 family protein [Gemmataceae bacterium]|nr:DUF1800 family protein [Gemmataceae bacterium]
MFRITSPARVRSAAVAFGLLAVTGFGTFLLAQTGTPSVRVRNGTTIVAMNGTVGFGTSPVGVAKAKTFTVKNTGAANLLVSEAVAVPPGFTVMASFPGVPNAMLPGNVPAYTLAPNATATFTIALNSASAGAFAGNVTFATNVTGKNPFTFKVTGTALPPPAVRCVDDGGAGFTATAGWGNNYTEVGATGRLPFQRFLTYAAPGTGAEAATWTFTNLEPGQYVIAASWIGYGWGASNAPFTVLDGATPLTSAPIRVNQRVDAAGFADAAANWQTLGTFTVTGSTLAVKLTDDADGYLNADAVRIQRVGYPGAVLDDTSPGFTTPLGTWVRRSTTPGARDFQGSKTYARPTFGAATAQARWTFNVTPGTYCVLTSYFGRSVNASNAPFRVFDGATNRTPTPVRVNQRVTPSDLNDAGRGWRRLGFFKVDSTILAVELANNANGRVIADAVRVERVNQPTSPSTPDTVRFLEQATWGPTPALIGQVQAQGFDAWLDAQFAAPVSVYPDLPLYSNNNNLANNNTTSCFGDPSVAGNPARSACIRDHYSQYPLQTQFFRNALYAEDQLRQRLAWSLHKIWVVSGVDLSQPAWVAPYLHLLNQNAFGNYRTLMYDITLNPAMGNYLDMAGSRFTMPNENYPRELLQLFTIGLVELNPDGSTKKDAAGVPLATYDQALVNNVTKVFTGWNFAPAPAAGIPNYKAPMRLNGAATEDARYHDITAKTLLRGFVQPARARSVANAYLDLNEGLDNIYHHPNVGPFICKQLIQHFVTSNPSPAYVARVADTFDRNRASPTQLQAVVRAILLDPEARGDRKDATNYGHLKEPVLFVTNLMRMFNAKSADRTADSDGYLNPDAVNLGQDVFRPPSVFSYYSPFKVAAGGTPPILGPEFQLLTTSTAIRRVNFVNQCFAPASSRAIDVVRNKGTTPNGVDPVTGEPLVKTGPLGTSVDVSWLQPLAADPAALVEQLNVLLLHGTMTAEMRSAVVAAVSAVAGTNPRKRTRTAVYLIASSAQYQVQR